jgi:hypothetical protein
MTQSRWDEHLLRLHSGPDLEAADVQWRMNEILSGTAEIELIKSFLNVLDLQNFGRFRELDRPEL